MPDPLSETLFALSDPTRRAMLARLASGEASVSELAEPFALGVRAISKHLAVLERAGLVVRGRDAQRRPSKLRLAPLQEVDVWLHSYRSLWGDRMDRVADVIAHIKGAGANKSDG